MKKSELQRLKGRSPLVIKLFRKSYRAFDTMDLVFRGRNVQRTACEFYMVYGETKVCQTLCILNERSESKTNSLYIEFVAKRSEIRFLKYERCEYSQVSWTKHRQSGTQRSEDGKYEWRRQNEVETSSLPTRDFFRRSVEPGGARSRGRV